MAGSFFLKMSSRSASELIDVLKVKVSSRRRPSILKSSVMETVSPPE